MLEYAFLQFYIQSIFLGFLGFDHDSESGFFVMLPLLKGLFSSWFALLITM